MHLHLTTCLEKTSFKKAIISYMTSRIERRVLHSLVPSWPISNIHLLRCHHVFLPRLQAILDNHPIKTEGNMTPNQLKEMENIQHYSEYNALKQERNLNVNTDMFIFEEKGEKRNCKLSSVVEILACLPS